MQLINVNLMRHPINWVTVMLMVFTLGLVVHFFASYQTGTNPFADLSNRSTA